jgi:hypothetical protein
MLCSTRGICKAMPWALNIGARKGRRGVYMDDAVLDSLESWQSANWPVSWRRRPPKSVKWPPTGTQKTQHCRQAATEHQHLPPWRWWRAPGPEESHRLVAPSLRSPLFPISRRKYRWGAGGLRRGLWGAAGLRRDLCGAAAVWRAPWGAEPARSVGVAGRWRGLLTTAFKMSSHKVSLGSSALGLDGSEVPKLQWFGMGSSLYFFFLNMWLRRSISFSFGNFSVHALEYY